MRKYEVHNNDQFFNQKSYKHKDLRIKSKRIRYKNKVIDIREIKEKISNSLIEYYKNNSLSEKKKNNITVQQFDLNNNLINTYYSLSEAARSVNASSTNIIYASNLTSTNKNKSVSIPY